MFVMTVAMLRRHPVVKVPIALVFAACVSGLTVLAVMDDVTLSSIDPFWVDLRSRPPFAAMRAPYAAAGLTLVFAAFLWCASRMLAWFRFSWRVPPDS